MAYQADVLLVTVTKVESKAVLDAFAEATKQKAKPFEIDGRTYFELGAINGAPVCMTQSEMGAGGLDASLLTVQKGIDSLSPAAVIMVGIAFGVDASWQKIGDILVSENLRPYELQRVGTLARLSQSRCHFLRGRAVNIDRNAFGWLDERISTPSALRY